MYQLDGADLASTSAVESGSGYKCSTFGASSASEPRLAVGGFDGRLQLWDLQHGPRTPLWDTQAHASIVNGMDGFGGQVGQPMHGRARMPCELTQAPDSCLCCCASRAAHHAGALPRSHLLLHRTDDLQPFHASALLQALGYGPPELVTCGRDGCVRVWDVRQRDAPVAAFEPAGSDNIRHVCGGLGLPCALLQLMPMTPQHRVCAPNHARCHLRALPPLSVCVPCRAMQGLLVCGDRQLPQRRRALRAGGLRQW